MAEAVSVRCPSCLREHLYAAPVYPCACGAPLAPPLLTAPPERFVRRTWDDDWVLVRCLRCGRRDHWPQPELGCPCGTLLRIPVRSAGAAPSGTTGRADERTGSATPDEAVAGAAPAAGRPPGTGHPDHGGHAPGSGNPPGAGLTPDSGHTPATEHALSTEHALDSGIPTSTGQTPGAGDAPPLRQPRIPLPRTASTPRPSFRPLTIRTAADAITTALLYLTWLGFRDVVQREVHPPEVRPLATAVPPDTSAVSLRGPGLIAQVDPSTRQVTPRDIECLWLNGLSASVPTVHFSLAGYSDDARARAAELGVPLFVMDLTGTPQPVNRPAEDLFATGP